MIARRQVLLKLAKPNIRYISNESTTEVSRRFMQTIPSSTSNKSSFYSGLNYSIDTKDSTSSSKWSKHALKLPTEEKAPVRRSRTSRFSNKNLKGLGTENAESEPQHEIINIANPTEVTPKVTAAAPEPKKEEAKPKKKRTLRPRKALITLSPNAVEHLRALLNQPEPKLIRIGVQNRGCSGLTYNLEYVDKPGKFDELIEQDGVKVLIDSKALFSIVGSEMDWLDDKLSSRFIFKNPNSKGTCGCGESFMV